MTRIPETRPPPTGRIFYVEVSGEKPKWNMMVSVATAFQRAESYHGVRLSNPWRDRAEEEKLATNQPHRKTCRVYAAAVVG